jgi:hypothetical protein
MNENSASDRETYLSDFLSAIEDGVSHSGPLGAGEALSRWYERWADDPALGDWGSDQIPAEWGDRLFGASASEDGYTYAALLDFAERRLGM